MSAENLQHVSEAVKQRDVLTKSRAVAAGFVDGLVFDAGARSMDNPEA